MFITDSNVQTPTTSKRAYKSQNLQVELALDLQKDTVRLLKNISEKIDEVLSEVKKISNKN